MIALINVFKAVIIVHNINMNIMENVMKNEKMEFYMRIIIELINVNVN